MDDYVEVVVGFLATHPDGHRARLGEDVTAAELYARKNHATLETMYVKRPNPSTQFPPMPASRLI